MTSPIPLHPDESIRIAFFLQAGYVWPNWRSIWQACREHPGVTPHVVLVAGRGRAASLASFDRMRRGLLEEGVPFFTEDAYDLDRMRPHVAFLSDPYDGARSEALASTALAARGVRVAYVGYAMEIGGGLHNLHFQNELDLHRTAWRLFARTERHRRMIGRYCPSGDAHVVVTGHPKIDQVHALDTLDVDPALRARIGDRKVLLWTPHFTLPEPPIWSTFERYGETILALAERHPELYLLLRPHPGFFPTRRLSPDHGPQWERDFRARIDALENVELDDAPDHLQSFAVADALLADAGSLLLEFLPTGRPVQYLVNVDGLGLNDDRDLVRVYDQARRPEDVEDFVERVLRGEDPRREQRLAAIEEFVGVFDGRAGARICEHVVQALRAGDAPGPSAPAPSEEQKEVWRVRTQWSRAILPPVDHDLRTLAALKELCEAEGPFDRVLDTQLLDGRFTALVAPHAARIDAVEPSPSLLRTTTESLRQSGLEHVHAREGTLEDLHDAAAYDLMLFVDTFHFVVDPLRQIRAFDRLLVALRPGGTVFVRQATARASALLAMGDQKIRVLLPRDLVEVATARGLELVDERVVRQAGEREDRLYVFRRPVGQGSMDPLPDAVPEARPEARAETPTDARAETPAERPSQGPASDRPEPAPV